MSLLGDRTASEDVVHDVFVMFIRNLDNFRLTGSRKSCLMTCTANNARNRNKAGHRRASHAAGPETEFTGCIESPIDMDGHYLVYRWISSMLLPAGSSTKPTIIPSSPKGAGSTVTFPPEAFTAATVAFISVT